MCEEKASFGALVDHLRRILEWFKEDYDKHYFCCLIDPPEDYDDGCFPDDPFYAFYSGEGGQSLNKFVRYKWTPKHMEGLMHQNKITQHIKRIKAKNKTLKEVQQAINPALKQRNEEE